MITKSFESYNVLGELTSKKTFKNVKSTWQDLTLKEFIAYNDVVNEMNKYESEYKKGDSIDSPEEYELKSTIYFADMLIALTGLPKDIVYTMNAKQLSEMYDELEFTNEKLPQGHTDTFFFRTKPQKFIADTEAEYNKIYSINFKKKAKAKAELELMKKSKFQLKGSVNDMALEKWIATRGILKDIKSIQVDLKNNDFRRYPLLIAYLVEQNGQVLTIEKCKRLATVFEELPFCTAYEVVSFFLNLRTAFLKKTIESLMTANLMMKTYLKR